MATKIRLARGGDIDADIGDGCDACGVAAETVGDIDHGVEVVAEHVCECAGLAKAGLEDEVSTRLVGVADAACDIHGVSRFGCGTEDGAADGVG